MYKILDLFCGEGGGAVGYYRCGEFEITGVDILPQRRYPFDFILGDALEVPLDGYDFIHASPPCKAYSVARNTYKHIQHPELIPPTRKRLRAAGVPYIIENVPGAPLIDPVLLCGAAMGCTATDDDGTKLVMRRHRLFESNIPLEDPQCKCKEYKARGFAVAGVYGGGSDDRTSVNRGGYTPAKNIKEELMGLKHMSRNALNQAIPPAYTEYLGNQVLSYLKNQPR